MSTLRLPPTTRQILANMIFATMWITRTHSARLVRLCEKLQAFHSVGISSNLYSLVVSSSPDCSSAESIPLPTTPQKCLGAAYVIIAILRRHSIAESTKRHCLAEPGLRRTVPLFTKSSSSASPRRLSNPRRLSRTPINTAASFETLASSATRLEMVRHSGRLEMSLVCFRVENCPDLSAKPELAEPPWSLLPDLASFLELARDYDLVPVNRRLLSDTLTRSPLSVCWTIH